MTGRLAEVGNGLRAGHAWLGNPSHLVALQMSQSRALDKDIKYAGQEAEKGCSVPPPEEGPTARATNVARLWRALCRIEATEASSPGARQRDVLARVKSIYRTQYEAKNGLSHIKRYI